MKYLAVLFACSILLSGCMPKNSVDVPPQETAVNQSIIQDTSSPILAEEPAATTESIDLSEAEDPIPETKPEITAYIYSGDDNAINFIVTEFQVNELNTDILINKLIEVNALSEGTKVLSERIEGTCLYLDMNSEFGDLVCSMGTSGERIVIGSLVNTFIHNYMDTVQTVSITVDGEILESGHVVYDFELSYIDNTDSVAPAYTAYVYSGDDNAEGFILTEFQVDELTTDQLIEKLIEVNVLSEGTQVLSERIEGTCLYLDLNSKFGELVSSMGTSGERIVIGSLVNTFIHNFNDSVQTVYITVDDQILESGHVIYDFELGFFE